MHSIDIIYHDSHSCRHNGCQRALAGGHRTALGRYSNSVVGNCLMSQIVWHWQALFGTVWRDQSSSQQIHTHLYSPYTAHWEISSSLMLYSIIRRCKHWHLPTSDGVKDTGGKAKAKDIQHKPKSLSHGDLSLWRDVMSESSCWHGLVTKTHH